MLAKRIIPCLDVRDGMTVKGVNFVNIREVGDAVDLGAEYARQGADELVFLDITATHEGRKTFVELVKRIAKNLNIPFTVGGGINELKDIEALLSAGADKVSINSAAIRNPELIDQMALNFGSQFVVVAVDARESGGDWTAYINGGRIPTDRELFSWAKEAENRGAGEILFTSMNHDGTKNGFACEALARMSDMLSIPVIASGGAGTMEHYAEVFTRGKADAGLAASIFHFKEISVPQLKDYLHSRGIPVRLQAKNDN
jgi:cyclase